MQNDDQNRSGLGLLRYIWTEWISTFVVLVLLLLTLIIPKIIAHNIDQRQNHAPNHPK